MPRNKFFYEVLSGVSVVKVSGDLAYPGIEDFLRFCRAHPGDLVIDISKLEYLDSSGLGALLSLNKERSLEGSVLVVVPNETSNAIFNLTRVNGIFRVATDIAEALSIIKTQAPA